MYVIKKIWAAHKRGMITLYPCLVWGHIWQVLMSEKLSMEVSRTPPNSGTVHISGSCIKIQDCFLKRVWMNQYLPIPLQQNTSFMKQVLQMLKVLMSCSIAPFHFIPSSSSKVYLHILGIELLSTNSFTITHRSTLGEVLYIFFHWTGVHWCLLNWAREPTAIVEVVCLLPHVREITHLQLRQNSSPYTL